MPAPRRRRARPARRLLFLVGVALFLAGLFASGHAARHIRPSASAYVAVFDAGSTGTRVHVYRYDRAPGAALPVLTRLDEGGVRGSPAPPKAGPLSSASQKDVPALLTPLLDWAEAAIPAGAPTEAVFLATAGLRALPRPTADALVAAAAATIRSRPGGRFVLRPGGAAVLAGADEAALAWAAANAAAGSLEGGRDASPPPPPSVGIIELGGASLQVAFEVGGGRGGGGGGGGGRHDAGSLGTLRLGGHGSIRPRTLYARSFEGLGHEAAAAAAGVDGGGGGGGGAPADDDRPCLPPAAGEAPPTAADPFATCQAAATTALAAACGHGAAPHCPLPALAARARPPPRLDGLRLIALENLAHTAAFLLGRGGTPGATLADVAAAGRALCTHGRPAAPRAEAARHCFGAAYAVSLLHDAFGVRLESDAIDFSGTVAPPVVVGKGGGGGPPPAASAILPEWAAGAALVAAAGGSAGRNHPFAAGVLAPVAGGGHRHHLCRVGRLAVLILIGGGCAAAVSASSGGGGWPAALAARARRSLAGDGGGGGSDGGGSGEGGGPSSSWPRGGRGSSSRLLLVSRGGRAGGGSE